jgi:GPH family glycoside/pentoside/hexuronide:cation symporter
MAVPACRIDEKRYCRAQPSDESFFKALKTTLRDHNFRVFIAADFAYYMAVAVIVNSLMYYVKVLLRLPEKDGPLGMAVMVIVSLVYYIFIRQLEHRFGRKRLVIFSFFFMSLIFVMVYFFGRLPMSGRAQLIGLGLFFSLPLTLLGVLPNAIIAGIASDDAAKTGVQKEGMFFAVRYMFVKMGQTLGFSVSAMLTLFGKDVGHDQGIRLTGVVGAVLCVLAGFVFFSFREIRKKQDLTPRP